MAQKGPWNVARKKMLQDRGALLERVQGHARRKFPEQLAEGGCGRHRRTKEKAERRKAGEEKERW